MNTKTTENNVFPKNRNIFHNHQFLAFVGRAMRAPTNGTINRNLAERALRVRNEFTYMGSCPLSTVNANIPSSLGWMVLNAGNFISLKRK